MSLLKYIPVLLFSLTLVSSTLVFDYIDITPIKSEYDFIIVGAGSAGSVLANRLSEVEDWSILLLEAGGAPAAITEVPFLVSSLYFTEFNWNYHMEKQDNACLGLIDGLCPFPRGKALGGTSVINYMIDVRGNSRDYDRWADLGNDGWSYDDVLPYFKKTEDFQATGGDEGYHNTGGYLTISDVPIRTESAAAFLKATNDSGYNIRDYNGAEQTLAVNYVQAFQRNGSRCSAEKGYLRTAKDRSNLRISPESRVTKILIDPETKRATGVQFKKGLLTYTVSAKKEVILSAGTFHSPQLLMLSGVGPKDHLEEMEIEVLVDSPVGQILWDHNALFYMPFIVDEPITFYVDVAGIIEAIADFAIANSGTLTSPGGIEALACFRTNISVEPEGIPDVEFYFFGASFATDKGLFIAKSWGTSDEVYDYFWKPLEDKYAFMIAPMPLHPKSRGYMKLRSTDPTDAPILYGGMFTDPDGYDMRIYIESIREIERIISAPAFQVYSPQFYNVSFPGCEGFEFDSDDYWECVIRHTATSVHHQSGVCKMGPDTDPEAVVDSKLRVRGVEGLRVVDGSVMPYTLSGHFNAPILMIAEKASDVIKKDWLDE